MMKLSKRFNQYKVEQDALSTYLGGFDFIIEYFSDWPDQANKRLTNISPMRMKIVIQECGVCKIQHKGQESILKGGGVAFIPPYAVYSAETDEAVHSYELFFYIHPVIRQNEFLQQMGIDRLRVFPDLLKKSYFEELRSCYEAVQGHEGASYARLQSMLRIVLCEIASASGSHPHSVSTPREQAVIDRLLMYLNEHMSEKFHTADACEVLSVSQSYLCRCANAVMGCSTAQLIARYKLMHARQLLFQPSITVSEAAAAIGYDVYYFSSQFKLHFGVSPSEFRALAHPADAAVLI